MFDWDDVALVERQNSEVQTEMCSMRNKFVQSHFNRTLNFWFDAF